MIIVAKYIKPATLLQMINDMTETHLDADGVYALHSAMQEYKALTGMQVMVEVKETVLIEGEREE